MGLPSTLLGLKPQNFSLKKFILFYPKKRRSEKISYIFSKESFCYISVNETLHFSNPQFEKKRSEKISYIFSKESFCKMKMKKFP